MERTYSVPSRKNKDRRPINNESDWRRGQRRYIQQSEVFFWGERITEYVKRETKIDKNCQMAYLLIFEQCTEHMRSKIEAREDHQKMIGDYDVFLIVGTARA